MRDRYPPIKPGTFPTRQHFNSVSQTAQRLGAMHFGKSLSLHGHSFSSFDTLFQGAQFTFEITNTKVDDDDTDTSGKYLGKIIRYSHDDSEWKDEFGDDSKEWEIDGSGTTHSIMGENERVTAYWNEQRGMFIPNAVSFLQGICLAQNHPGKGVLFNVYIGVRNKDTNEWDYYESPTFKCIDWRHGVPYPGPGSTGLAEWRWSNSVGYPYKILEVVALDCETPGPCFS